MASRPAPQARSVEERKRRGSFLGGCPCSVQGGSLGPAPSRGSGRQCAQDAAHHVRTVSDAVVCRLGGGQQAGTDLVVVAEILGHSMETARRYALPSPEDRHTAINRLTTDQ